MKLADKIAQQPAGKPFYTFEFFPPRTEQGFDNLIPRISRLVKLKPIAVSITWGAGGSTKERSLELAALSQGDHGIDTIMHLTCTNMEKGAVDSALRAAKAKGIQNILALRGDPPRGEEYWTPIDPRFTRAIDLVKYIKTTPEFSDFCVGVAAYPDGHPDHETNEDNEISYLKEKIDAGAEFVITQLFYDPDRFLQWLQKVRASGIKVPVIPGMMPIQTFASFQRLVKLTGAIVPASVSTVLDKIKNDDSEIKEYGISLASEMIRKLISSGHVHGVHFCTLNLEKSVQVILENLQWTRPNFQIQNRLISESRRGTDSPHPGDEFVITPSIATNTATSGLSNIISLDGEVGKGELNQPATWDEYPNGRFGDFKSPAYGDQGLWGGTGTLSSDAISKWGSPSTVDDLTRIFLDYLHSRIETTPFSSSPLSTESRMILSYLDELTQRGLWTVGSQPAIDGVPSADEVVGWGPAGGYVYQKSFVEFFATKEKVELLEKKINEEGKGWVDYFACSADNDFRSNIRGDARNAVTWGVFPGQEISQSTIIERESFLTWKDEAFSIWSEWSTHYPPGSPQRTLLEGVVKERWLVTIVHHDYKNLKALWTFLLEP